MNAELKITGRLAEVGNLDGGSTPGASIYAGDGRYIEVHNLSEDEARAIAPAFGEMVTVSIALAERTTAPVTDEQIKDAAIAAWPDLPEQWWDRKSEVRKAVTTFARALLAAAPAPIQQAPQATLICPTCGKDRFKEPCPNMADECPMIADAHLLAPPALAGSQVQAAGDEVNEREAFEAWQREKQGWLYTAEAEEGTFQEERWIAWQARAAMREQQP